MARPGWAGREPGLDGRAHGSSWAGRAGPSWPGRAAERGQPSHAGREISCWEFKGTKFFLGLIGRGQGFFDGAESFFEFLKVLFEFLLKFF